MMIRNIKRLIDRKRVGNKQVKNRTRKDINLFAEYCPICSYELEISIEGKFNYKVAFCRSGLHQ